MAKQEVKGNEPSEGHQLTRGSQPQATVVRTTTFPLGMAIAPGEFFRMNPFSLMRRMGEEMDRVFGEFGLNRGDSGKAVWAPTVEVSEKHGQYRVRAELPGMSPNDVKVEITDEAVILQGERKAEHEEDKQGLHITERQYGQFYRSIPLPEGAKASEAKAKFENGMLEITVPLQEQKSKAREVPVESSTPTPPTQAGAPGKAA